MAMAETMGVMPTYSLDNGNKDEMFGGGGMWIFFLFFLLAWGGNGFGGFGGGANGAISQISNDFMYSNLSGQLRDNSLQNTTILNGIQQGLCNLGYENLKNFDNLGTQMSECCCSTQKEMLINRYEAERNTCSITNAIHADGEATRALINANTMQDLRDRLQAAEFGLSQATQTANIVSQVRPFPTPAYITCSPYSTPCGFNGSCGC